MKIDDDDDNEKKKWSIHMQSLVGMARTNKVISRNECITSIIYCYILALSKNVLMSIFHLKKVKQDY
jgi:hypothetical protein